MPLSFLLLDASGVAFFVGTILACGLAFSQSLQITAPSDGIIVNPGESVAITVSASGTFSSVGVIAANPMGASQTLSSAPFQFTLQIPTAIKPGPYSLSAAGTLSSGSPVFSSPITLQVERADAPVSLSIQPPLLHFFTIGTTGRVRVLGSFADGTTTDLTNSSLTSYSSGGNATPGSYGVVTATQCCGDTLQVTYGSLSASISVTIEYPFNTVPQAKALYGGQTQQFSVQTAGLTSPSATWSISPNVGIISSTGLYTAPSSITQQQQVTVTATSTTNNTLSSSSTITLNLPVLINVIPSTATLASSQTQGFGTIVLNAPFTDVIWDLPAGSPGTLDQWGHYTAPSSITSQQTVTVQAISAMDGSTTGSATVTLAPPAAAPVFSPAAGTYALTQTVTITTTTPGASIRYTTDGTTPSETAGTLYSGAVTVGSTETLNAIAYTSGYADSPVASATYTIVPPVNVSGSVQVTSSGLAYSRVTQEFIGTITVTNTSGSSIAASISVAMTNLPSTVTLANATGYINGAPYIQVLSSGSLAPGQSATVTVEFKNPSNVIINLTPVTYSGL